MTEKKVVVDAKTIDVTALIEEIQTKTAKANESQEEAAAKQVIAAEQAKTITAEKAIADEALMEALPAVEAASRALENLDKNDLTEVQQKMYKIVKKIWNDPRSKVFQYLDADSIPGYNDVIETPLDLATIQKRLTTYEDDKPNLFLDDIELVLDNAVQYNVEGSIIANDAIALKELANGLYVKHFTAGSTSSKKNANVNANTNVLAIML